MGPCSLQLFSCRNISWIMKSAGVCIWLTHCLLSYELPWFINNFFGCVVIGQKQHLRLIHYMYRMSFCWFFAKSEHALTDFPNHTFLPSFKLTKQREHSSRCASESFWLNTLSYLLLMLCILSFPSLLLFQMINDKRPQGLFKPGHEKVLKRIWTIKNYQYSHTIVSKQRIMRSNTCSFKSS